MAPTKGSARRGPGPSLNRVHSGRVGQTTCSRTHINKNRGKELLSITNNKGNELFPATENANKELFPELLSTPSFVSSTSQAIAVNQQSTLSQHPQAVHNRTQNIKASRPATKRSFKHNRGKAYHALQAANLEQRQGRLIQDGIAKRLEALQVDFSHTVRDARDSLTIPYAAARLDMDHSVGVQRPKKLKFSIAVGFWGYAPVFTPVKIFSLSSERFADADGLAKLVYGNTDVQKAIAGIGLDIETTTAIGYEMSFPKGYRYLQGETYDHKRDCPVPFQVAHSEGCALVNTSCALKEFFWQTARYASDDHGNVLIPVTVRIGITQSQPSGEVLAGKVNVNWRNVSEKRWEAEEKRRGLERQLFATGAERLSLDERMKVIEDRTKRAMENSKALKESAAAAATEHSPTVTTGSNLGIYTQSAGLSVGVDEDGTNGVDNEMELELDLDLF